MKTFFSLISIQTNSFSLEKVVVGVLAITENKVYFEYSKTKLQLLDKLAPSHNGISQFANKALQQIKKANNNLLFLLRYLHKNTLAI